MNGVDPDKRCAADGAGAVDGPDTPCRDRLESNAFRLLVAAVFAVAFSLPVGRGLLAAACVVCATWCVRRRRLPRLGAAGWFGLAFLLVTVVATFRGIDPELGVPKLRKLVWFMGMPVAATLLISWRRVERVVAAYALGCGVLALRTFVSHPVEAWRRMQDGRFDTFGAALIDTGSMTDGQRFMVGALAALGLAVAWRLAGRGRWPWWLMLLGANLGGLLINFKRGSWFCALAAGGIFMVCFTRLRTVAILALVVLSMLAVPTVRQRLGDLRNEFQSRRGGRWTMWTRVAPELVRRYPWGVGYRSLRNETLRSVNGTVEPGRDHLHSNPVQVLVESGWLGLALYLAWMAAACADGVCAARRGRTRGPPTARVLSVLLLLMLASLILNGLVEYNLGDAELVLMYGVLIGALVAARGLTSLPRAETSSARSPVPAR